MSERYAVVNGECLDEMRKMDADSMDAIVTDPPYGLAFMGAKWDSFGKPSGGESVEERREKMNEYLGVNAVVPAFASSHGRSPKLSEMREFQATMTPIFAEALRVAKPGAYLLCFGGTRTFHRMACAIEDAGWSVRDTIMWVYGSGFPHGMDVSKAIDKALGAKREKVVNQNNAKPSAQDTGRYGAYGPTDYVEPTPATEEAAKWSGYNTQLKPSWESIIVAQKVPDVDIVIRHLEKVEECLYKSHVRIAENNSTRTQIKYEGATDDSAHGNARTHTEDSAVPTIQVGMVEDTNFQVDTSELTLEVVDTALNMTSSWKSTLEEACELTSKYTTEMVTSLTTDLRTWSCCLLQTTPDSIIVAATNQNGSSAPALDAARLFSVVRKKLNAIHILTAQESATWDDDIRPAWEPIIVAQKPLDGTVAHNVLTHGVGAMNIDACRVPTNDKLGGGMRWHDGISGAYDWPWVHDEEHQREFVERKKQNIAKSEELGRYPANLIHDGSEEVVDLFPNTKSATKSRPRNRTPQTNAYGTFKGREGLMAQAYGDEGSAARFFYCAKASKKDRGEGNTHPTCKPTKLMRYLVKLVCPTGGTVLDPFMGSGSTGVAALQEGMRFVGIDMEEEYCEMARKRMGEVE